MEDNVRLLRTDNLLSLERMLNEYFKKGYSINGGVSQLDIGGKYYYCCVVSKPF